MNGYLKQATASQVRTIGPFIDDTDFKTLENALTINNTDIVISINGGADTTKTSGGATAHGAGGIYTLTWDATDTATVGELYFSVKVAGALVVFGTYVVLEEAVYDAMFAASAPGYLQPTVAGRTLDVAATGEAGLDFNNILSTSLVTLHSLTVTGATTLTGNVSMAAGLTITQSTLNASALRVTGNGTGHGFHAVSGSGATGNGAQFTAASTDGSGINTLGTGSGYGLAVTGGATGHGINATGGATSGIGIVAAGAGTGNGMTISSGAGASATALRINNLSTNGNGLWATGAGTGHGIAATGGSTGNGATFTSGAGATGSGIVATAASTNGEGMKLVGVGSGSALEINGGTTGYGIYANGNGTKAGMRVEATGTNAAGFEAQGVGTGDGMVAVSGVGATGAGFRAVAASTNGDGFKGVGNGTGNGMLLEGGAGAGGDGLEATAGGGVPIRGNITGNITGTIDTVTTATNVTTVNGFAANSITAAAIAAGAIDNATFAADVGSTAIATNIIGIAAKKGVVDALNVDTYAEPAQGTPAATTTMVAKLGYLFKAWRNRTTQTATQYSLYNDDAATVDHKATTSDDATTYERTEITTGP